MNVKEKNTKKFERARALAHAGMPPKAIAKKIKVSYGTVLRWKAAFERASLKGFKRYDEVSESASVRTAEAIAPAVSQAEVALAQALDRIRDLQQTLGHYAVEQAKLKSADRRPVDAAIV